MIDNEKNDLEPLVSVLVQTYQHASYIGQCLDSVLEQRTSFDYEILVGEDDSKDGTRDICKEYERLNPGRIRLFLHDRKNVIYIQGRPTGRYNFINNLKSARGKYLAFCEGDDYWTDRDKLQKQVDFLESNPDFVGCYHNVRLADDEQQLIDKWKVPPEVIRENDPSAFLTRLKVPVLSAMIRRNAVSCPKEFYTVLNADTFLMCMVGRHGKLEYLPEISDAVAHIHHGGIWSSLNEIQKLKASNATLRSLLNIVEPEHQSELRNHLVNQHLRLAKISLNSFRLGNCITAIYGAFKVENIGYFLKRFARKIKSLGFPTSRPQ